MKYNHNQSWGRGIMKNIVIAIINICLISLLGCFSSEDSNSDSSVPSISQLYAYSNQPSILSISFDFNDSDGDISTITINLYDAKNSLIGSDTEPIDDIDGITTGYIYGDLDFSDLSIGNYTIEIYLTDKSNHKSNVLSKTFSSQGGLGTSVKYDNLDQELGNVKTGDLNGDARNDVVALPGYYGNKTLLLIYYQNNIGNLNSPVTINFNISLTDTAIADINNDGRADLIACGDNGITGKIFVLLQDADTGQLKPAQEYIVNTEDVGNIAVADLNNDGLNDIIVSKESGGFAIFFQSSNGILGTEVDINDSITIYKDTSGCHQIQVADINNDGYNDIVVQSGKTELSVIKQISPGIFNAIPDQYSVETSSVLAFKSFTLGDVNGDSLNDIVVAGPRNNCYINVFRQNSIGGLDRILFDQGFNSWFGVKLVDISGDGLNDIVMYNGGKVVIFSQQNDHTFGNGIEYSYWPSIGGGSRDFQGLSIEDVTGDGFPDVIVGWSDGLYVIPHVSELIVH
jgi:hypothetical protein